MKKNKLLSKFSIEISSGILNTGRLNNGHLAFVLQKSKPNS